MILTSHLVFRYTCFMSQIVVKLLLLTRIKHQDVDDDVR